jgi:hypothetical protein
MSLYRFVRDAADSDAGLCRWVTGGSATYEQTASSHGRPAFDVRGHGSWPRIVAPGKLDESGERHGFLSMLPQQQRFLPRAECPGRSSRSGQGLRTLRPALGRRARRHRSGNSVQISGEAFEDVLGGLGPEVLVVITVGDQEGVVTPWRSAEDPLRVPAEDIARDAEPAANELPGRHLTAVRDGDHLRDSEFLDDPRCNR